METLREWQLANHGVSHTCQCLVIHDLLLSTFARLYLYKHPCWGNPVRLTGRWNPSTHLLVWTFFFKEKCNKLLSRRVLHTVINSNETIISHMSPVVVFFVCFFPNLCVNCASQTQFRAEYSSLRYLHDVVVLTQLFVEHKIRMRSRMWQEWNPSFR